MLDGKQKSNIPSCSICKFEYDSYYRIPRVIPKCGHTFCEKCINLSLEVKGNRKVFTCPECQSETVIRKNAAEDVPKNIGILDIAKNLKKKEFEENSPMRFKSPVKDSPSKIKVFCSLHPNKELDLVCETCNFEKVCSICALMSNNHNEHKFVEYVPASKFDLNEVKEVFTIIEDTVKMTILPNASENIIKKTEEHLVNQLIETVKDHFKDNYYKIIEKKENEVISQVKEIKFEGGISKKIEEIAKTYDMLKIEYSSIFKKSLENHTTALETVEDFIQKCKNLHNEVEIFSEHAETKMKTLFKEISTKINQSFYFRINELPFSLKNLLHEQIEVTSPTKYKSEMRNSQIKKGSLDFGMKSSARGERSNSKRQDDLKSLENLSCDAEKKPFTAGSINAKKSGFMPPKQKINKSDAKFEKSELDMIPILHIESKVEEKKNQNLSSSVKVSSNTERLNKSSFEQIKEAKKSVEKEKSASNKLNYSHIARNEPRNQHSESPVAENQLKLKEARPTKEIPLNIKSKFSAITKEIIRQADSQSLELIGMEINDALIVYIVEYLKSKKMKFSMIKLVKNNLTDEGLSVLLGYLANDDTTQVLNLTSNQLTPKCLDLFIEVGMKNSFLKTIYLSHNKVASLAVKQRANELSNLGLELIL